MALVNRVSSTRALWSRVNFNNARLLASSSDSVSVADESKGRKSSAVVKDGSEAKESKSPKGKMDLNPPKGTRDFFPEDQRLRNWLFGKWRNIADRYGFEEYDAPVLESEDLYIRKAGEEVTQQLYNFEDKGGRRLALRPEMTPSLARMVLSRKGGLSFPLKWYSIPQCWRYERMTRGRRREHYQWNMDIWGVKGVEAEAELLSAIVTSFKDMGIGPGDVGIKINSRKILTGLMASLGVPEDKFAPTCVLVDKLEKIPIDAIQADLEALGLTKEIVLELVASLQIKDISKFAEKLGSSSDGVTDIKRLFELAEGYGIREWLEFDASVVRGLSYYTGIVFEGFDKTGELRAICGGGRYDALLESMGGEPLPAVGFGFGDAVIVELLKMKDLLPDTTQSKVDVIMFPMEDSLRGQAVAAATTLRAAGVTVDMILESKKPKWVFQRADKLGASAVIMFAPDETVNNKVVLKTLATGEQVAYPVEDLVGAVLKALDRS
jgi:histidyl-tRNA synthetase